MRLLASLACLSAIIGITPSSWAGFEEPSAGPAVSGSKLKPKPWDISIHVFLGKDSNVPLAPDDTYYGGEDSSVFGGFSATGTYRFIDDQEWLVGVSGRAERLNNFESEPDIYGDPLSDYNFWTFQSSVFAVKRFEIGGKRATAGASYTYRQEGMRQVAAGGLDRHSFSVSGSLKASKDLMFDGAISYSDTDFEVDFPMPELDRRDGKHMSLSLKATNKLNGGRQKVSASYGYADNDADGRNFDYDGHTIAARLETHVYGPVWAGLDISYNMRDYRGFESTFIPMPGRNDQDILSYGAQVLWPVTPNLTLDFNVKHTDYDANMPQFRADRTKFGVGVTIKF